MNYQIVTIAFCGPIALMFWVFSVTAWGMVKTAANEKMEGPEIGKRGAFATSITVIALLFTAITLGAIFK